MPTWLGYLAIVCFAGLLAAHLNYTPVQTVEMKGDGALYVAYDPPSRMEFIMEAGSEIRQFHLYTSTAQD